MARSGSSTASSPSEYSRADSLTEPWLTVQGGRHQSPVSTADPVPTPPYLGSCPDMQYTDSTADDRSDRVSRLGSLAAADVVYAINALLEEDDHTVTGACRLQHTANLAIVLTIDHSL